MLIEEKNAIFALSADADFFRGYRPPEGFTEMFITKTAAVAENVGEGIVDS